MSDLYPIPLAIATYLGYSGYRKGSLALDGALTATAVGYASMANPFSGFGLSLIVFYLTGSKATKFKRTKKEQLETHAAAVEPVKKEEKDVSLGNRSAVQVLCNSATAVLACIAFRALNSGRGPVDPMERRVLAEVGGVAVSNVMMTLVVGGHYAACMGDTLASELGILSTAQPRLVTKPWRTVPKGTNGGVSPLGLLVSALGGTLIGVVQSLSLAAHYHFSHQTSRQSVEVFAKLTGILTLAGLAGSLIDSILGATLQKTLYNSTTNKILVDKLPDQRQAAEGKWQTVTGWNVLDNNAVNFVASAVTALGTAYFGTRFL